MRGFFNGLVLGIILGAVGFWFLQKKQNGNYKDNDSGN